MSNDKKKSKRNKIIAISIAMIVVGGGGFMIGWLFDRNWYFSTNPTETTPDLDGVINEREWMRSSYYNIPFYLDVNNSIDPVENKANFDGWNYLSVGEDEENYYVALDLCSDRTNNMDGEWLALGLGNRIPDTMGPSGMTETSLAFYAVENYGFEYLIYNVSADKEFDYELLFLPESHNFDSIPFVPEYNSYEVVKGETDGNIIDMWAWDEPDYVYDTEQVFTMISDYYDATSLYNAGDYAIMDFGINVTEIFPTYNASDFTMTNFGIDLTMTANVSASESFANYNTTADTIWFSILEHGPMPVEFDDPLYMSVFNNESFINNGYFSFENTNFDHTQINATNGMFYFSLAAWNPVNITDPTAFELYINKLTFKMRTNWIKTTRGTTIASENYELAFSYGESSKCVDEHRMFEFRIAKSEFPSTSDDKFYLSIAGYGTMAMEGTDYWKYPMAENLGYANSVMWNYYDTYNDFLTFDMSIT